MTRRLLTCATAVVLLSGCAMSPQGLERPEFASVFLVDQPYQLTLKNIVESEQSCRRAPLVPLGGAIDDVHHYPDLREAKIVYGAEGFGRQIYQVTHINEVDGGSQVTVYARSALDKRTNLMRRWAVNDRSICHPH
ncbi:hypothetical protein [Luteimonas sp. MHLX1A]|uniref:hypothetical protein n=1 Tax=Alterluteimonas muca TaxID=2878684 RepID=UPI001E289878|nr:hypothetical protein [Luteimonas sp. MHLX1A]MCD9046791.1 hypothetical protein [Luteimonas sp. MHLX1A]